MFENVQKMRTKSYGNFLARFYAAGLAPERIPIHYEDEVECKCMVCGSSVEITARLVSTRRWRFEKLKEPLLYGCFRCTRNNDDRKQELIITAHEIGFILEESEIPENWHSKTKVHLQCATPGCYGTASLHYNQMNERRRRGTATLGCRRCSYIARRKRPSNPIRCTWLLTSGTRKGDPCGASAAEDGLCANHRGAAERRRSAEERVEAEPSVRLCSGSFTQGPRKGKPCERPAMLTSTYCAHHEANTRRQAEKTALPGCTAEGCTKAARPNSKYCGYHKQQEVPVPLCAREGCGRTATNRATGLCASDDVIRKRRIKQGLGPELPPIVQEKKCPHCDTIFSLTDRKQKFCSNSCAITANKRKYNAPDRTCCWCEKIFQPKTSREQNRYFCSNSCRNANRTKELREKSKN